MSWVAMPPDNPDCTDPWHTGARPDAPHDTFTYRLALPDGKLTEHTATGLRCLGCGSESPREEAYIPVQATCETCGRLFESMPPPDVEGECVDCFKSRFAAMTREEFLALLEK